MPPGRDGLPPFARGFEREEEEPESDLILLPLQRERTADSSGCAGRGCRCRASVTFFSVPPCLRGSILLLHLLGQQSFMQRLLGEGMEAGGFRLPRSLSMTSQAHRQHTPHGLRIP